MSSWPRVPISELCELAVDCVNKTAPVVEWPTPYKMIRTTNVRSGWVDVTSVKYVTAETFATWTRRGAPRPGDVILTREAPLGEVGLLRSDENVFLGQRLFMYRTDPSLLDNRYLAYVLQGPELQGMIRGLGSGATVPHMRVPDCESLPIPTPALSVQRAIADTLGAFDDLIENNRRRVEILEEMARSIFREWFVHFRFPGHEDVELVDSELGPVPDGWAAASLADFAYYISRGIAPKYDDSSESVVINQRCIRDHRLLMENARRHVKAVPPEKVVRLGDVLVNSTGVGTLGRVAPVRTELQDTTVDSHVTIIRPRAGTDIDYFAELMLSLEVAFEAMGVGSTGQTELNRTRIGETMVVVAPQDLQTSFGDVARPLRRLSTNLLRQNEVLQEARDLVLPRLVAGELDVSELDLELVEVG